MPIQYTEIDLRSKTTSKFRTVFSQVLLYIHKRTVADQKQTWVVTAVVGLDIGTCSHIKNHNIIRHSSSVYSDVNTVDKMLVTCIFWRDVRLATKICHDLVVV